MITPHGLKIEFPPTTCKERKPYSGIKLCKPITWMRRGYHGGSSKETSKRNIFSSITMKYFFELKLGTMTMEEYENTFFELLKYVDFIKDEKVKSKVL
jgi:hypothetical protein